MTKKTPEETGIDMSDLRDLLVKMQTMTQTTIQQQTEAFTTALAAVTDRLDALTTALTIRVNQQDQPVVAPQRQAALNQPLPPRPQPHRQQQQLPPIHQPPHHHQQRQQHHHQFNDARARDLYEEEEEDHHRVFCEDLRQRDFINTCWEQSFKVDIPEFHGGLKGDDLIDWLISVEEIMEFKQVPPNRRVALVVMRFRGHTATWWKQLKTTRSRTGKEPINSWEKLTKHLRQTFLPHNYERTMYTKLQNLRQGNHTVDEYAEEFSMLLTRNEINDSQVQLISHFIGGLRPQLQSAMAQFDPSTIGEAHRRATSFEQQSKTTNWFTPSNRARSQDHTGNNTPATSAKEAGETANSATKPAHQEEQQLRRSTRPNALRCYTCGELGHRQTACPHATKRGLVMEETANELDVYDSQEEDDQETEDIIPTTGDTGHLLVVRRTCLAPRLQDDKWLRTNIFRSTCTIKGRVCTFVIDSGSSKNVISEEAVDKLGFTHEAHPAPYTLGWLNDSIEFTAI
uniref:CCHC-type domain-containing protein n=1 Tax=Brassica oleracea var. oleracea TaxID=109376 RepID=A0A0D3CXR5_BRAOL